MTQNTRYIEDIDIVPHQLCSKSMSQLMPSEMERYTISQSTNNSPHVPLFQRVAMNGRKKEVTF